ncbi:MAG: o-succinylbenzoate synthase [Halobacteria archaeon]|nr:o-succinylbenzoate synthase [Halobacteria archaeon]
MTSLEAEYACFSLDLKKPLSTARGEIESRDGFLIRLTDGEYTGYGEATPLPPWTETHDEAENAVYRSLESLGSTDTDDLRESLPSHETPSARYGISLALADLRAKRRGVPLYEYLGDSNDDIRRTVRLNATVGDADVDETLRSVGEYVDDGYPTVKIKVGSRDLDEDVERVRAIDDEYDVKIRADANGGWSYDEASEFAYGVSDLGSFEYLEQPLEADDLEGHSRLRRSTDLDIGVDESLIDHSVSEVVEEEAADYVVLKPMSFGGVEKAHEVGEMARQNRVVPVVSNLIETVVGRSAGAHLAASLRVETACGLGTGDMLAEDLGDGLVENGFIRLSDGSGNSEVDGVW